MCGQRNMNAQRKCAVKKCVLIEKMCGQRIRAVKSAVKKSVALKSALFGATQNVVKQRKKMWSKLGAT